MIRIVNLAVTPGYQLGNEAPVCRLYFQAIIKSSHTNQHPFVRNRFTEKIEDFCSKEMIFVHVQPFGWPIDSHFNYVNREYDETTPIWGTKIEFHMRFEDLREADIFRRNFLVLAKLSGEGFLT